MSLRFRIVGVLCAVVLPAMPASGQGAPTATPADGHTIHEPATDDVQVRDLPPDKAKGVEDLVATTDGIIDHLWSHDAKVPSGHVIIGQSVGHVSLTAAQLKQGAGAKAGKP